MDRQVFEKYLELKKKENESYLKDIDYFENRIKSINSFPLKNAKEKIFLFKNSILLKKEFFNKNKKYISFIEEILRDDIYPN